MKSSDLHIFSGSNSVMKRTFVELAALIAIGFFAQSCKADTLIGPGGAFQPWTADVLGPTSAPTNSGKPYWNNRSGDGPTNNIGWCMTGTGGCVISSPPGAISYYGTASGAAVQSMSFQGTGVAVTVSLSGLFTNQLGGRNGVDYFGWYAINPDGTIGAMTTLWTSLNSAVGTSAVFTPKGNYGLFLENVQGNGSTAATYFWFMDASKDFGTGLATGAAAPDSRQHFAVFSGVPNEYYIGIDDTNTSSGADGDYNDLIIKLVVSPEPGSVFTAALGLLLCGVFAARRQRQTGLA